MLVAYGTLWSEAERTSTLSPTTRASTRPYSAANNCPKMSRAMRSQGTTASVAQIARLPTVPPSTASEKLALPKMGIGAWAWGDSYILGLRRQRRTKSARERSSRLVRGGPTKDRGTARATGARGGYRWCWPSTRSIGEGLGFDQVEKRHGKVAAWWIRARAAP